MFVICSLQGFAYQFELYKGQDLTNKPDNEPDLGATSNVVLRLARGKPKHVNHIIYYNNVYTDHTYTPRGFHEERITTFQGVDMSVVT